VSAPDRRRGVRRGRRREQGRWIRVAAVAVAVVLAGAIVIALRYGTAGLPGATTSGQQGLSASGPLASDFTGIVDWENSAPLTMDGLRGKVVLVDFWTYSCINCQRTFPFLRQWWDRYGPDGLVIVGVHSPEFTFEKSVANVRRALKDYEIGRAHV